MHYDRAVLAYHGCDVAVAERLLAGEPFRRSENDYDWLGSGIYFWEYGVDRALEFAREQHQRGRIAEPAVVGALVQLGHCFDLMDTRFMDDLEASYHKYRSVVLARGATLPANTGRSPDRKLRRLDCAVLNHHFTRLERLEERSFDTARCGFVEGEPVFPGSEIHRQTHVQLAVRNRACILGVFRPTVHV